MARFGFRVPRANRIAILAWAGILGGVIAGCDSSQSGSGTISAGGGNTTSITAVGGSTACFLPQFALPIDNPNPGGSSARNALDAFLAHGSVVGAAPPIESPAKAGYPTTGWTEIKAGSNAATFQSGGAQLGFTRVTNGDWVITSGRKNC